MRGWCAAAGRSLSLNIRSGMSVWTKKLRTTRAGIWQWQFDKPWDWRAGVLQQAVGTPEGPDGCVIKGNISSGGERIYHMPFHQYYGRTRIDERRGERWFCNEHEAQQAGWRRALR